MGRKSSISIGDKNGKLTVLDIISKGSGRHVVLQCVCNCGNVTFMQSQIFKKSKSCGCNRHKIDNLINKIFGKIIVLELIEKNSDSPKNRGHLWKCKCTECNSIKNFRTSSILRAGFIGCKCDINCISSKNAVFCSYKYNAKKRNLKFNIEFDHFIKICESKCFYCGATKSNIKNAKDLYGKWEYNGIDRIDNAKGYNNDNCVSSCRLCNKMKGTMEYKDFINHINNIHKYNRNQEF